MLKFIDQLNREILLPSLPRRIISLVPSQTELLYDLDLRNEVAGITKFCIHPDEWFRSKPRIGGTKKVDLLKIEELNPDLIIGNKEENDQSQILELMKKYPVWMSDVKNLGDALQMIEHLGELTGKTAQASRLKNNIEELFLDLGTRNAIRSIMPETVYLIWKNPLITVGRDTFIHDMLTRCGLKNVFGGKNRYPEISEAELAAAKPQFILLSSEPYPFREKDVVQFRSLFPGSKVIPVDGELFSWYGSRMLKAPDYFRNLVEEINAGD